MKCLEAKGLFSPWLDGELTDEEKRRLQNHLSRCRSCAEELEKASAIKEALSRMRLQMEPPEGFTRRLMERLREELAGVEAKEMARVNGKVVSIFRTEETPGRESRQGQLFAGYWQRVGLKWKKSMAVAAAFVILLGGSAAVATRYMEGPGTIGPSMLGTRVLPPETGDAGNIQTEKGVPGDEQERGPDNALDGEKEEKKGPISGKTNEEHLQVAGSEQVKEQRSDIPAGAKGDGEQQHGEAAYPTKEPKVFLHQPRVIESVFLKFRVDDVKNASYQLVNGARARGVTYSVNHKVRTSEDKVVEIFRLAAPSSQAESFSTFLTGLGQVVDCSREVRDVSNEFAELFSHYQKLIAERKTVSQEQVKRLDEEIQKKEAELETINREATEQVIFIVWLEN